MKIIVVKDHQLPTTVDLPLDLNKQDILRRQHLSPSYHMPPRMSDTFDELLGLAMRLFQPAIAFSMRRIVKIDPAYVQLETSTLKSPLLSSTFTSAQELVALICTIGLSLEERVKSYFKNGDSLKGILLDGIGNAAVDSLASQSCTLIKELATSKHLEVSSPLSPGMEGFSIDEQRHILNLVAADHINVSITAANMLVPQKSASMVFGLGSHMPTWDRTENCKKCSMAQTCRYRLHC